MQSWRWRSFRARAERGSNPRVWEKVASRAKGTSYTHARIADVMEREGGGAPDTRQKERD